MKKILFSAYDLNVGGIETALLTLLNHLVEQYEITLVLEHKRGVFLEDLDERIQVIEYTPKETGNVIFRKGMNLLKRWKFSWKHHHKYDFAASFATSSRMGSFVARSASENNALWVHVDYLAFYYDDVEKMKEFFSHLQVEKFRHIVFVSKKARDHFSGIYQELSAKALYCNNLINYDRIRHLSQEKIQEKKSSVYTFLNVGRQEERQKRLTRIIEAARKLKEEGFSFRILLVGDGPQTEEYKGLVKKYHLEKQLIFLGRKKNPYPYYRISDAIILSSDYEGYPVVFVEAFVLGKPIITTDVSDALEQIPDHYGIVTQKDVNEIYEAMKQMIEKGYPKLTSFDPKKFNQEILEKIKGLIEGE